MSVYISTFSSQNKAILDHQMCIYSCTNAYIVLKGLGKCSIPGNDMYTVTQPLNTLIHQDQLDSLQKRSMYNYVDVYNMYLVVISCNIYLYLYSKQCNVLYSKLCNVQKYHIIYTCTYTVSNVMSYIVSYVMSYIQ